MVYRLTMLTVLLTHIKCQVSFGLPLMGSTPGKALGYRRPIIVAIGPIDVIQQAQI
jgi:hypothetical protein